jgi:hypothetical protein
MTTPRPKCVCCGKPYGSRSTTSNKVLWRQDQPMPAYHGNGIVVKVQGPWNTTNKDQYAYRQVWDGVTWFTPYKPFCTLRCALVYARAAYANAQARRVKL